MADAETKEKPEAGTKGKDGHTLSQSEIDNLLGFQGGGDAASGIRALLDKSNKSYERLPILEIMFARYAQALSGSFKRQISEHADVSIDSITSLRFEDYIQSVPQPTLITVFQAAEWENYGLINLDGPLCYSMVDILLGGGKAQSPAPLEKRPFTSIEQEILKNLGEILLEELSAVFAALTPVTFRLERVETIPSNALITRPSNAVILLALRLDIKERGGRIEVLIPYATLEPIKDQLIQMVSGEAFGADPTWETHFTSELYNAHVDLEVVLRPRKISLKELATLKVGSTIIMHEAPNDELSVMCKGIPMLTGRLGKKEKNVALRVSEIFNKNMKELL